MPLLEKIGKVKVLFGNVM